MSDGSFWEIFLCFKEKECKKGMFTFLAFGHGSVKMRCLELLQPFCQHEEINLETKPNMVRMTAERLKESEFSLF